MDGQGREFQVTAGHDRYFYRRSDQTWIGLGRHEDPSRVPGWDPNDFEELRVRF